MTGTSITCGRARRALWPNGGPQAVSPDVIEAQAHLAQCETCQRFVREMRTLAVSVRDAAPREQAPAAVRARLFTGLARLRAGTPPVRTRTSLAWLIAASALIVAVIGGVFVQRPARGTAQTSPRTLVEDHVRALGDARIVSADPAVVSRWLAAQVHFAMLVPSLPNARLLGARLRLADGVRGAIVQYDVDGVAVSYFVTPDLSKTSQASPQAARYEHTAHAGYRVVTWREPGLVHAMVGGLPENQLTALADACIKQARGTVAAGANSDHLLLESVL